MTRLQEIALALAVAAAWAPLAAFADWSFV